MKKTPKARTPKKSSKAQARNLTPPPLALAIATRIDPSGSGDFVRAYQHMPALLAKMDLTDPSDVRYRIITNLSGFDAAEQRAETGNPSSSYAILCEIGCFSGSIRASIRTR